MSRPHTATGASTGVFPAPLAPGPSARPSVRGESRRSGPADAARGGRPRPSAQPHPHASRRHGSRDEDPKDIPAPLHASRSGSNLIAAAGRQPGAPDAHKGASLGASAGPSRSSSWRPQPGGPTSPRPPHAPAPAAPAAAAPTFVAASHPPHHSHSQPHGADVGVSALPGVQHSRPKENQDSLFFQSLGGGDFVAGVLDGHGHNGGKISKWVAERLKAKLLVTPLHPATAEAVLVDMFVSVHAELAATAAAESAESGTTVVVCVKRGGTLYVANAGDSRCVLGHMTGPARMAGKPLTSDHTPIRPDEAARIVQSGGVVGRGRAGPNGPPRVYNPKGGGRYGLCLSRSVGDCSMATAGVVPVPEVTVQPLGPNDKFVLLASDGVWAAISTEEAAEVAGRVTDPTRAAGDVSAATQAVWAQRDPAYRDDITVLILKLRN